MLKLPTKVPCYLREYPPKDVLISFKPFALEKRMGLVVCFAKWIHGLLTTQSMVQSSYLKQLQFVKYSHFLKLGFTSCKAEQPLQGMELQEKEAQKD